MGRKQDLENQIAENEKALTDINKTKEDLDKKINVNNDDLSKIENYTKKCALLLLGSFVAAALSLVFVSIFPLSIIPTIFFIISGVALCSSYIAAWIPQGKYMRFATANEENKEKIKSLEKEELELYKQKAELQGELNKILTTEAENNKTQNLQQPKVLHSKEFKQFKNYLSYKNNKTEQSTEQKEIIQ